MPRLRACRRPHLNCPALDMGMDKLHFAAAGPAPVTVAEFKAHARITHSTEDALIGDQLAAAWGYIAQRLRLGAPGAFELKREGAGPHVLDIPRLVGVTEVSARLASAPGFWTQLTAGSQYTFDATTGAVAISSALGLLPGANVLIRFAAGWANAAAVPDPLKLAVKLLAGIQFFNRTGATSEGLSEIPHGITPIIDQYKWGRP